MEGLNRDLIQRLLATDKGDKHKSNETDFKAILLTPAGLKEHQALIASLKQGTYLKLNIKFNFRVRKIELFF